MLGIILPSAIFAAPGDLDTSFNSGGILYDYLEPERDFSVTANDTAIQPDGKILVAGTLPFIINSVNSNRGGGLTRYLPNGSLDAAFGTNGRAAILNVPGGSVSFSRITLQPDGKILVIGSRYVGTDPPNPSNQSVVIARYNSDGTLDRSFNGDGSIGITFAGQPLSTSSYVYPSSITIQPDGKVLAGIFTLSPVSQIIPLILFRYNPDGSPDASFGENGKVMTQIGNTSNSGIRQVFLQSDGKIVVLTAGVYSLVRLNANGSFDTSFNINDAANQNFTFAVQQADGKIVGLNVQDSSNFTLSRFSVGGAADSAFGVNGTSKITLAGTITISKLLIQRNGKFVTVGRNGTTGGRVTLVRLNQNGALDANFGQGGVVLTDTQVDKSFDVNSAAVQPDGKIVVVGNINPFDRIYGTIVLRYLSDGATSPLFDFDGDGKTDLAVFRDGIWHIQRSRAGFTGVYWGLGSDTIAPADYDGDGKTDTAVYRPSIGEWSVLRSSDNTAAIVRFGLPEDLPRPADFDGDGKADICVFRPSSGTWFRLNSSDNQFVAVQFGTSEDNPIVADFDGDGKADIAVYRPSSGTWYWLRSSDGHFAGIRFGTSEDKPAAADYDGDGKTDIAVWRPSNAVWYRLQSSNNRVVIEQLGTSTDVPIAADYDGDGKGDLAVFRPSSGEWILKKSQTGLQTVKFGLNGDKVIPNAFVR